MRILFDTGYWLSRFVASVLMGCRAEGREYLPREGAFILAPNHISNLDPPLVGCYAPRRLHFFAKKELFDVPVLGWLIRNVNSHPVRRGGFDRKAIRTAAEVLRAGSGLVIFPEGTRGRDGEFREPKAGISMIARATEVPIVPCYIQGSDRFRRCFLRRERLRIAYGPPIPVDWIRSQENSKLGWKEIAREVMRRIGVLKELQR